MHGFRRTVRGGPAPIPPVAPNAKPVRGKQLRSAVLVVLALRGPTDDARRDPPRNAPAGIRDRAAGPGQRLADCLGYELTLGRARRIERGVYALGVLNPAERRRVDNSLRQPPPGRVKHFKRFDQHRNVADEHALHRARLPGAASPTRRRRRYSSPHRPRGRRATRARTARQRSRARAQPAQVAVHMTARCRCGTPAPGRRNSPFVNDTANRSSPASCGIVRSSVSRPCRGTPASIRARSYAPASMTGASTSCPDRCDRVGTRSLRRLRRRASRPRRTAHRCPTRRRRRHAPRTASAPHRHLGDLGLHPDLEPVQARRELGAETALAHAPPRVGLDAHDVEVDEQLALGLQQQRMARNRPPRWRRDPGRRGSAGTSWRPGPTTTTRSRWTEAWNESVMILRRDAGRRPLQ